jgi:zona occludens toxin (predicted ATPase)
MITLITGTPGAGKTLRAVHAIVEALQAGRPVYSDVDGIEKINDHFKSQVTVVGLDHDWRDTPEGSLVVYDECQRRWPSTGRPGQAPDEDIRALETHRHTGHDIIIMTQAPTLVHHHVRRLAGEHIHIRRVSNANAVSLFIGPEVFDPQDSKGIRKLDKQIWKYPKEYFDYYSSATKHTHQFKLPARYKILGVVIVVVLAIAGYLIYSTYQSLWGEEDATQPAAAASPIREAGAPPALPLSHPESGAQPVSSANQALVTAASVATLPVISGCLSVADDCRCWSSEGLPLDTTPQQCELLLADMPRALGGFASSRSGGASAPGPNVSSESVSYVPFSAPANGWSASGGAYAP